MRVAIQGEAGSFSHEAAGQMLPEYSVVPCARSLEVFDLVDRARVQAAVIPIENSLAGSVAEHFDLLLTRDVFVQREFRMRIAHNLMAIPGVKLGSIRRVFSHPVALDQCRDFFRRHRSIEPVPFYDTAGSVKHIMSVHLKDAAAIAGRQAARVYGAAILQSGIEDDKRNFTRFFLVRKGRKLLPGANKTSIAFKVKNAAGVLFKALSVFALRDISLSKIESRPLRGQPWEYVFYLDFLCGEDEAARNALHHLEEVADFVKILGVYPAARPSRAELRHRRA
ncbi:MAG TPA: prephenate dehydratase [Terriglobales bacterium]|nr:prephenate dehydratase [Terriglobales bacterium]